MGQLIKASTIDEICDLGILEDAAITIGVFDGFHIGHQEIINQVKILANNNNCTSAAVTFIIDPDELFASNLKKIMTNELRLDTLVESGVDCVIALPFDKEVASIGKSEFTDRLFGSSSPSSITVGDGFRYGYKAEGSVSDLAEFCELHNAFFNALSLVCEDGSPVSSTRIRHLLANCNFEEAALLLGHPYILWGDVQGGSKQGREMGFKTANLHVSDNLVCMPDGVYAGYGYVDGKKYKAAISVGIPPTFKGERSSNIEVHLLDFNEEIYGSFIGIEPREFLREMKKFDSTDELIKTVQADISYTKENM